jgi:HK97 family phage portal protein
MSTALVPVRPSLLATLRGWLRTTPDTLTRGVTTTSTVGWTIARGQTPSDFQGTGEEVRLRGWERHPVVAACVRAITDLVAAVPLEMYRRDGTGAAVVLPNHEALALFRGEQGGPSEYRLKARTAQHFLTYGNAFWVLERNGRRGLPRSIRIVPPAQVQYVWLDPATDLIATYDWRDVQGTVHTGTSAEDMVHFRDLDSTDGIFGYPRGAAALRSILADSEASEYVRQVVTNHGTPGVAVMVDGSVTPEELEAGRQRWQERWVERGGRGGASFMAGVLDIKPLGFNLAELEFPDLRAVTREDICVAFAVDRRMVGVSSGTSDGGLSGTQFREARHRLIQQAVYPVMRCIEDEINHVLTPEYGEVYCRFSEEYIAAITEDVTQTSARVVSEVAGKIRTVEEARDAVGLPAEMDPTHTLPGGMTVGDAAANAQAMQAALLEATTNPPPPADGAAPAGAFGRAGGYAGLARALGLSPEEADRLWRSFDETARRQEGPYERTALALFRAEGEDVARLLLSLGVAADLLTDPYVQAALARIGAAYAPGAAYHRAWLTRYVKLIGQTVQVGASDVAARVGISFTLEHPRAQAVIRQRAADLVTHVTETTRDAIREAVLAGRTEGLSVREIAKRIQETTFGEISAARAVTIARTETVGALNAGAFEAARSSNVMRSKEWLTQGDDRVRETHAALNGQRVDIGAAFGNGLRYPHDPAGPAEETVNCRCTLLYSDLEAGAT